MIYVLRNGKVVPKHEAGPHPQSGKRPMNIVSDLEPFVSMVDGTVIGSRTDRREHNKRNGVVDIGNDPAVLRRQERPAVPDLGEEIARQWRD